MRKFLNGRIFHIRMWLLIFQCFSGIIDNEGISYKHTSWTCKNNNHLHILNREKWSIQNVFTFCFIAWINKNEKQLKTPRCRKDVCIEWLLYFVRVWCQHQISIGTKLVDNKLFPVKLSWWKTVSSARNIFQMMHFSSDLYKT